MYLVYRHNLLIPESSCSDEIVCTCFDYETANLISKLMNHDIPKPSRKCFVYRVFNESVLDRHSKKLSQPKFGDPEDDLPF